MHDDPFGPKDYIVKLSINNTVFHISCFFSKSIISKYILKSAYREIECVCRKYKKTRTNHNKSYQFLSSAKMF